jgi:hypothetical protein
VAPLNEADHALLAFLVERAVEIFFPPTKPALGGRRGSSD